MKQVFRKQLKVRSQSPYRIEWEVKNADPYIQSLKLRNEQLQLAQLVAPMEEECWLNCVLISQSVSKILYLSQVNLEVLEKERVRKLQQVSLTDGSLEPVRLAPGEGYESIFKVRISHGDADTAKKLREIDQFAEL